MAVLLEIPRHDPSLPYGSSVQESRHFSEAGGTHHDSGDLANSTQRTKQSTNPNPVVVGTWDRRREDITNKA